MRARAQGDEEERLRRHKIDRASIAMARLPWAALVVVVVAGVGISTASSSTPSCPLDFSYVSEYYPSACQETQLSAPSNDCCLATFNAFGLGLAVYLRDYHIFELPDNATAYACYDAFESSLQKNGLQGFSVLRCTQFRSPIPFIRSPTLCSGIETLNDWKTKVGSTSMDSSCKGDLSSSAACQVCNNDAKTALAIASNLSAAVNHTYCIYFVVLYASGVVNDLGPTNPATATCLLALKASSSGSSNLYRILVYACVGATVVVVVVCATLFLVWLCYLKRQRLYHERFVKRNKKLLISSFHPNVGAIWYKFDNLKSATNNFAPGNVIGAGGFATVYKGIMLDGSQVAVKRIKNCSPEGDAEFGNEVEVINSVRHRNLVALRGCCVASNTSLGHVRLLIYDYMPNGSLENYLFSGKKPLLEWPDRQRIAVDAARGLAYLHTGVQPAIIHRDIKANNILLDEHLNAYVADFGLAKVTAEGMSHMTTRVAGTQGYLAPEYALYGQLTEKSDVYSFGVLLLVLMTGIRPLDVRGTYSLITDWAWVMVKEGNTLGIVDERIRMNGPPELMERFVLVGILCAHLLVAFRPTMSEALKMLRGDADIPQIPDRPLPLTHDSLLTLHDDFSFYSLPSTGDSCTYDTDHLLG